MRVSEGHLEIAVRVGVIAERAAGEAKHAAGMARREGNLETVRSGVGKSLDAIRPEVVVLALLTVRNHRRSGDLELRDCVANGRVIQRVQGRILRIGRDRLNQRQRSRDAANRLRRDVRHGSESGRPFGVPSIIFYGAQPIKSPAFRRGRRGRWRPSSCERDSSSRLPGNGRCLTGHGNHHRARRRDGDRTPDPAVPPRAVPAEVHTPAAERGRGARYG